MRNTAALNGPPTALSPTGPMPTTNASPVQAEFGSVIAEPGKERGVGVAASDEAMTTLHWAVGIIVVALLLLWLLGGIVFRNANL